MGKFYQSIAREFYEANPIAQKRSVQQGLEAAEVNVKWLEHNGQAIISYFNS